MTSKNNKVGFVLAGLLLAMLMASMDNTIVATAMGTIVGDLGGLDKFVWVTSAYHFWPNCILMCFDVMRYSRKHCTT